MTDDVSGEKFREQILGLLDACSEQATEAHRGGYGTSVVHAPYPPILGVGPIPSGLRPGRLCLHLPDGTRWMPDRLRDVLGRPVQHPVEPSVFAGVAIDSGASRCWIADAADRSVTFTGPTPALLAGDDAPVAWAGSALVVPVDPPPGPYAAAPQIFEAPPGERIRVITGPPAHDRRPCRFVALDPADGGIEAMPLTGRPYQRVRGAATGHIAASTPAIDTGGEILAVGGPDSADEHLIAVGNGPLHDFCWLTAGAELVMVIGRPDGFDITACAVSDHTVEPSRLLHRHRGRYLHAHRQEALFVLALDADGSYAVLVVDPGAPRPVLSLALGLRPPVLLRIAAVAAEPGPPVAGRCFATVDADNDVIVWGVPAEGTTARRLSGLSLREDEELITVSGWEAGEVRPVCVRRRARVPLPAHPGGPPPLRGTVPAAAADFSLYLPGRRDPAAVLVWLSQAGETVPGGAVASPAVLDPHWLTLAGFGVLDVRLTPGWSPEVPDEDLRSSLVRQIRAAVLGSGVHRHGEAARLAVGGASFGATLALLAVADCDLFEAAIVQNGAYSRQLTPLGFQDETRSLWEAPRVYADFDAIVNAHRIRRPVLIIHGEADRNPATPVLQATLLFQALIANGTRARLVVLPGEGHVLRSRDGIAAALTEKAAWLAAAQDPL
ncbi:prolyl oligopeptidase family serine peptidase [Actinoallomurus sp. NPDC052308]|uniref:S9 family peptidase n=1 Tax=Actinoallomurus sp. NPDC052308 TaxID=3155530 RepID=UPI0034315A85